MNVRVFHLSLLDVKHLKKSQSRVLGFPICNNSPLWFDRVPLYWVINSAGIPEASSQITNSLSWWYPWADSGLVAVTTSMFQSFCPWKVTLVDDVEMIRRRRGWALVRSLRTSAIQTSRHCRMVGAVTMPLVPLYLRPFHRAMTPEQVVLPGP